VLSTVAIFPSERVWCWVVSAPTVKVSSPKKYSAPCTSAAARIFGGSPSGLSLSLRTPSSG
jgi:hypothetical protein